MAKYQQFEDLPVWQEAKRLYNVVLDLLEAPNVPLTPAFRNQFALCHSLGANLLLNHAANFL
jgi:hypothetical protein